MRFARSILVLALAAAVASCGSTPPTTPTPPPPIVSSITPSTGPAGGGTAVRITGANFSPGAVVTIGSVAAANVVVESSTSITATTGAHGAGAADVAVSYLGRTGLLAGAFTYQQASAPPVISAITVRGSRPNQPANFADIGEEITVTATVTDADTAADQLTFQWSANPATGTFTGTGASVKWRAPASLEGSNTTLAVRLTLVVSDGTPVTGTADVSVHDSIKEIGDLARQFLLDFSDSSKSPEFVVRNFSTSSRCIKERDSEYADVVKNREHYRIDSSAIGSASVTVSFATLPCPFRPKTGDACAAVPSRWNSTCLKTFDECTVGEKTVSDGTDEIAAVYEGSQWKLCSSDFKDKNGIYRPNFIR